MFVDEDADVLISALIDRGVFKAAIYGCYCLVKEEVCLKSILFVHVVPKSSRAEVRSSALQSDSMQAKNVAW